MPNPYHELAKGETPIKSWMLFVDGENFTKGLQKVLDWAVPRTVPQGFASDHWIPDVFIWMPPYRATVNTPFTEPDHGIHTWVHADIRLPYRLDANASRAYFYTSVVDGEHDLNDVRERLWKLGFTPEVFVKPDAKFRSKAVDITLSTHVLCHAFYDHYDVAILVAGDADYVPLVKEVKRMGKVVCVAFLEARAGGLSPKLRLAADVFLSLDGYLIHRMKGWLESDLAKSQQNPQP